MKIEKPDIPQALEIMEDFPDAVRLAREEESDIAARHIKEALFADMDFSKVCFRGSVFENCKFNRCLFRKTDFIDILFDTCDFSNSDFTDGYFNRCRFISCKGAGINVTNGNLKQLFLHDSNFIYSNFTSAKWSGVSIHECDMSYTVFEECKFKDLEWDDVNLANASFFKTPLKGMDFTNSRIDGIVVSGEELKGATVNSCQAADLARLLGLIVKQ